MSWDTEKGRGHPFIHHAFMAHVAEVQIDQATGKVDLVRYYAVHDSGKIVDMTLARGQILGAIVQGIGYALTENLVVNEGRILNANLLDYHIPTAEDIPEEMYLDFVQMRNSDDPKGHAEAAIAPVAAAVGGAIANATGMNLRELPYTPEKIWAMLRRKDR